MREVEVGYWILRALDLRRRGVEVISCPTCGRTRVGLIPLAALAGVLLIVAYHMSEWRVLVSLLEHHSTTFGGSEDWDVRNRTRRRVASGVYFYHIEAGKVGRVGRLTVINDRPGF